MCDLDERIVFFDVLGLFFAVLSRNCFQSWSKLLHCSILFENLGFLTEFLLTMVIDNIQSFTVFASLFWPKLLQLSQWELSDFAKPMRV